MLSLIIPAFNQVSCLELTLDSLARQTVGRDEFEVVVADDASIQDVRSVAARYQTDLRLRYVRHATNRGRSAARNTGVAHAEGDWLLLMDADSYPAPDLVERHLRRPGDKRPEVVYGRRVEPSWGTFAALRQGIPVGGALPMEGDHRDLPQPDGSGVFDVYRRTAWMFGFTHNLSLPAELYRDIGGFDETFVHWGYEDTDFTYRLYRQFGRDNSRFRFDPDALCYHMPHFRDWASEWENTKPVLPYLVRKYRHYDVEFFTHPSEHHRRVARTLPFYEDCRDYVRDHPGRISGDRVRKVLDLPDSARGLWLGFDVASAASPVVDTSIDHALPFGPDNPHLFGVRTPYEDGAFDYVAHLDLWRMLTPIDLSALLLDSLRIAQEALLVASNRVTGGPVGGIDLIGDAEYFLSSMVPPGLCACLAYSDDDVTVVRVPRTGAGGVS